MKAPGDSSAYALAFVQPLLTTSVSFPAKSAVRGGFRRSPIPFLALTRARGFNKFAQSLPSFLDATIVLMYNVI